MVALITPKACSKKILLRIINALEISIIIERNGQTACK